MKKVIKPLCIVLGYVYVLLYMERKKKYSEKYEQR